MSEGEKKREKERERERERQRVRERERETTLYYVVLRCITFVLLNQLSPRRLVG